MLRVEHVESVGHAGAVQPCDGVRRAPQKDLSAAAKLQAAGKVCAVQDEVQRAAHGRRGGGQGQADRLSCVHKGLLRGRLSWRQARPTWAHRVP